MKKRQSLALDSQNFDEIQEQIKEIIKLEKEVNRINRKSSELNCDIYLEAVEAKLKGKPPLGAELKSIMTDLRKLKLDFIRLRELPTNTRQKKRAKLGISNRADLESRFATLQGRILNWENTTGLDLFE